MPRIAAWDGGRLGKSLSTAITTGTISQSAGTLTSECYRVRAASTLAVYIRIGDGAQTAVIGDALLPANVVDYFTCTPGQTVAFISTSTSSGFFTLNESY